MCLKAEERRENDRLRALNGARDVARSSHEPVGATEKPRARRIQPFCKTLPDVRRLVHQTNAIMALTQNCAAPDAPAAIFQPTRRLNTSEKEWTMRAEAWSLAEAQLAILFDERLTKATV